MLFAGVVLAVGISLSAGAVWAGAIWVLGICIAVPWFFWLERDR